MFGFLKKKDVPGFNSLSAQTLLEYNEHRAIAHRKLVCHAPFKNLYFGHHGAVVACCYNRYYVLGNYPKESIRQIWHGGKAQILREYIKNNDLTLGCVNCEAQLLAGNFDAVKSKNYDSNAFNANGYPSSMEMELSNTCNLECEMCTGVYSSLIRAKREKLPPIENAYGAEFVEQLEEFIPHLEEIKFYGGEPFLIDIYYEIWDRVKKLNPRIRLSVQTNATTLNNRLKELMDGTNFHINVSLDSLQKEMYEFIRKNADFDRVMENIAYFHNYCRTKNTKMGISVCGMQQNWKELPDFVNYCNRLEVPLYIHTVFNPPHCALMGLKSEELQPIIAYLQSHDFPNNSPIEKKNRAHYFDYIKQVISWSHNNQPVKEEKPPLPVKVIGEVLKQHIRQNPLIGEKEKLLKLDNLGSKFKLLETKPEYLPITTALARLPVRDFDARETTISFFEKLSMEELLNMAKGEMNKQ